MSITPDFVGQIYKDVNNGNLWKSNSLASGDWSIDLQDPKTTWLPVNASLYDKLPFVATVLNATDAIPGITSVSLLRPSTPYIYIYTANDLQNFDAPNLTSITDGEPNSGYGIQIEVANSLTSLLFPALVTTENPIRLNGLPLLTSISFPSLTSIPNSSGWESLTISNCGTLTSISLPVFVPTDGSDFTVTSFTPLGAASVNAILALHVANPAYVSGNISLIGTCDAPTGQGLVDKATLIGRGVSVVTN